LIDFETEYRALNGYNCKVCGQFTKTNIDLLNQLQMCFTHFRERDGKEAFERGDLFT
jgi:hypothetical protein